MQAMLDSMLFNRVEKTQHHVTGFHALCWIFNVLESSAKCREVPHLVQKHQVEKIGHWVKSECGVLNKGIT